MVKYGSVISQRDSYVDKEDFLHSHYTEVSPMDFYRELFPASSFRSDREAREDGLCCGVFRFKPDKSTYEKLKKRIKPRVYQELFDREGGWEKYFESYFYGKPDTTLEDKYDILDKRFGAGKYRVGNNPIECNCRFDQIVHDDLVELGEAMGKRWAMMAPIGYFGEKANGKNASILFSVTLDLDGVGLKQLKNLIHGFNNDLYPVPTYLIHSGHGFHLYYFLEEPIRLYKYVRKPIEELKNKLISYIWNEYTSFSNKRDFQGWGQLYRMVGSQSKLGAKYPVTAYRIGKPVSLEYLNSYLYKTERIKLPLEHYSPYRKKGNLSLEECKELFPEWYKRVIEGVEPKVDADDPYHMRSIYKSWIKRMSRRMVGTRYHCMCVLFACASKCHVPYAEAKKDALSLLEDFDSASVSDDNRFTIEDINSAAKYYNKAFSKFMSIDKIDELTHIKIERNKRYKDRTDPTKHRTRQTHLAMVRSLMDNGFIQDVRFGAEGGNIPGRPAGVKDSYKRERLADSAEGVVREYLIKYKDARKIDVIKGTGLAKSTVYRHYDKIKTELYGEGGKTVEREGKT